MSCRVGFVGAGGIARRHADVLARFDDVAVVAVADMDAGRAAALAPGAAVFGDWRAMLDAGGLDALFMCVPPFAHGAIELAAAGRGIPFLVEKPLAVDLAVAERVAAAVEAAGLVTAVGYHWRYLDFLDRAREALAGRPARLVMGFWLDSTPPVDWWGVAAKSGGQMVEQATHLFDLARDLVGEAEVVGAAGGRTRRAGHEALDIADAGVAALRFEGGAVGTMAATCLLGWKHRVELQLFGDGLAIELGDGHLMIDTGQGRPVWHPASDPVEREDRAFLDAVTGRGGGVRVDYAEALRTHRLVVAARDAMGAL